MINRISHGLWLDMIYVFPIPSPRLGDRKHATHWIKIISNHKPWEILYLSRYSFYGFKWQCLQKKYSFFFYQIIILSIKEALFHVMMADFQHSAQVSQKSGTKLIQNPITPNVEIMNHTQQKSKLFFCQWPWLCQYDIESRSWHIWWLKELGT